MGTIDQVCLLMNSQVTKRERLSDDSDVRSFAAFSMSMTVRFPSFTLPVMPLAIAPWLDFPLGLSLGDRLPSNFTAI
jgi:hypothetical protein